MRPQSKAAARWKALHSCTQGHTGLLHACVSLRACAQTHARTHARTHTHTHMTARHLRHHRHPGVAQALGAARGGHRKDDPKVPKEHDGAVSQNCLVLLGLHWNVALGFCKGGQGVGPLADASSSTEADHEPSRRGCSVALNIPINLGTRTPVYLAPPTPSSRQLPCAALPAALAPSQLRQHLARGQLARDEPIQPL